MAEPQLSVRSASWQVNRFRFCRSLLAGELWRLLAGLLAGKPAPTWANLRRSFMLGSVNPFGSDVDLDNMLRDQNKAHTGIELVNPWVE